jgi:hypothetical protein
MRRHRDICPLWIHHRKRLSVVSILPFVGAHMGELASLYRQSNAGNDHDKRERRAQASWRDTVDAGPDDCRCFVQSVTFPG